MFIPGFAVMQYSTLYLFYSVCRKSSKKPIDKFCDLYLEKLCLQNRKCEKVSVGGEDVPLPLIWSARILILTPEMDSLTPKLLIWYTTSYFWKVKCTFGHFLGMLLHYGRGRCATPHKTNIFLNACKKLSRKPIEKFCDLYLEKLCLQNRKCEKVSVGGEDVPLPLIWSARILILTPEMDSLTPKTLYNMYHMLKLRWEVLLLLKCLW